MLLGDAAFGWCSFGLLHIISYLIWCSWVLSARVGCFSECCWVLLDGFIVLGVFDVVRLPLLGVDVLVFDIFCV